MLSKFKIGEVTTCALDFSKKIDKLDAVFDISDKNSPPLLQV